MVRVILTLTVVLTCAGPVAAQTVYVCATFNTPDMVGTRVAAAVKEQIRESKALRLAGDCTTPRLTLGVRFISADNSTTPGSDTRYAYAVTVFTVDGVEVFVDLSHGVSGAERVADVARIIVAEIDTRAEVLRRALRRDGTLSD